ncbi:MAG: hypothetical protein U1F60_12525 [Planctomycetota bacterium]
MTSLPTLWLPILLSAVFVFVASSLVHMVLQLHKGDYRKLPNEDALLDALRNTGTAPGQYMFPGADSMKEMGTPEMGAKFARGPIGTLIVRPGGSMNMGQALGTWFGFCLLIGVLVAYLTGLAKGPGADGVFRFASAAAALGYAFSSVPDSIWKGVRWSTTARFVFDGLLYALVTGATFAWLWPAAA